MWCELGRRFTNIQRIVEKPNELPFHRKISGLAWLPVPCLAIVLRLIVLSQAGQIVVHIFDMERVIIAFVL